jgi:hypothetical protein
MKTATITYTYGRTLPVGVGVIAGGAFDPGEVSSHRQPELIGVAREMLQGRGSTRCCASCSDGARVPCHCKALIGATWSEEFVVRARFAAAGRSGMCGT